MGHRGGPAAARGDGVVVPVHQLGVRLADQSDAVGDDDGAGRERRDERAREEDDLCQGAYDLRTDESGALRAVSQANRHPLVPDQQGYVDAPGGVEGFPLEELVQTLRQEVAKAQAGEEVTP